MKTKIIVLQSSEISRSMGAKCKARAEEFDIEAEVFNGIDEISAELRQKESIIKEISGRGE